MYSTAISTFLSVVAVLSRCSPAIELLAAGTNDADDEIFSDLYGITKTSAAAGTATAANDRRPRSVVAGLRTRSAMARSKHPDGTSCSTVEGPWLSSNLERLFDVTSNNVTDMLFDVRAVGSNWTGKMEVLFGVDGPVLAYISQPDTGVSATFVAHCRVVNGVESLTGRSVVQKLSFIMVSQITIKKN